MGWSEAIPLTPEPMGIASRLPDFPFLKGSAVPGTMSHRRVPYRHSLESDFYFGPCRTPWMGTPGIGQGRSLRLTAGRSPVVLMCRAAASDTQIRRAQLRRVGRANPR